MGGPNNNFEWEKDSVTMIGENNNTLQFSEVAASNAGLYQCTVTNAAGNDSDSTQLYVAPNIITGPENMTAVVGEIITFSCVAEGAPVPAIVWEYDGNGERNGSIFSSSLSNGSESGSGSANSSSNESLSGPAGGDMNYTSSLTLVLSDGQTVTVNTTVEGAIVTSTLTIDSVQYNNYGVYRCVASSSLLNRSTSAEETLSGETFILYQSALLTHFLLQSLLRAVC